jgi:hypothetical protein
MAYIEGLLMHAGTFRYRPYTKYDRPKSVQVDSRDNQKAGELNTISLTGKFHETFLYIFWDMGEAKARSVSACYL